MSDFTVFLHGLLNAFSWKDGQDNALIGGNPSWTYLVGLAINFLVFLLIMSAIIFSLYLSRKRHGSWKEVFKQAKKERIKRRGKFKTMLVLVIGFPMLLIAVPWYGSYRLVNGIWRYNYFNQQETTKRTGLVTNIDTSVGGIRSSYSRITMTIYLENEEHTVNISNSSKSLARSIKKELKVPLYATVQVNDQGRIVFID